MLDMKLKSVFIAQMASSEGSIGRSSCTATVQSQTGEGGRRRPVVLTSVLRRVWFSRSQTLYLAPVLTRMFSFGKCVWTGPLSWLIGLVFEKHPWKCNVMHDKDDLCLSWCEAANAWSSTEPYPDSNQLSVTCVVWKLIQCWTECSEPGQCKRPYCGCCSCMRYHQFTWKKVVVVIKQGRDIGGS